MTDTLLQKIKRTTRLPSPPGTAMQILRLCRENSDASIDHLAKTIAADQALSLRLLKYANSAMVGINKKVTSVREAVMLLGMRSVRLMALSFSLVSTNDRRACKNFDYGRFWAHSLGCAVAARYLTRENQFSPEEAFATGLLAHVGKLVFAVALPKEYANVIQSAGGTLGETTAYETECFGSSHYEVGADLITEWKIPQELAIAIRYQRSPEEITDDQELRYLATVVGTAAEIADVLCQSGPQELLDKRWESICASEFFSSQEQAQEAIEAIRKEFMELAGTLNLEEGTTPNADEIQAAAGEVLGELSLATQLKSDAVEKENQHLQEKAWTDGLTGIANRAAFDKHLEKVWQEAIWNKQSIGLLMLDIDNFKKFNDTYGHQTGDAVLKTVAASIRKVVRNADCVARYGGEEFVVILPRVDRLTAAQISVKVRKAVETCRAVHKGKQHKVTVSIGAALLLLTGEPFTPKLLIEAADAQLYIAKDKGRNCCSMKQLRSADVDTLEPQIASAG